MIGIATALLYGAAEIIHTQGILEQDLYKLQLAVKLFPFDFRFRVGLIQIADAKADIPVLLNAQKVEPNSVSLYIMLIQHMVLAGDTESAAQQFKRLYELAPNSTFTQSLLHKDIRL